MEKNDLMFMKSDIGKNGLYFTLEERNIRYDNSPRNKLHWHDYFEMEIIFGGTGTHIVNGTKSSIERGSVYLLTPYDFHKVLAGNEGGIQLININFSEQILPENLVNALYARKDTLSLELDEDKFSRFFSKALQLKSNYDTHFAFREEMMIASFTEICIEFLRGFSDVSTNRPAIWSEEPTIQRSIIYIKRNFKKELSEKDIAALFGLTPNYFGDLFKRTMGVTYTEYLQSLRLQFAANLIANSHLSISDIGYESGFHSPTYFIRSFHGRYGKTPAMYRKELPTLA